MSMVHEHTAAGQRRDYYDFDGLAVFGIGASTMAELDLEAEQKARAAEEQAHRMNVALASGYLATEQAALEDPQD